MYLVVAGLGNPVPSYARLPEDEILLLFCAVFAVLVRHAVVSAQVVAGVEFFVV